MRMTMLVSDWLVIDATMDNAGAVARQSGGRDDVAAATRSIRQEGWDQVATHGSDDGWPPHGATTQVELSVAQWQFVADQLRHWAAVAASVGDVAVADQPGSQLAGRIGAVFG